MIILIMILQITHSMKAQVLPELVFDNPVLENGTALKKGAEYRFSNVATGLDAIVKIKDVSDNNVVISSIDKNTTGWNKAFQPELGRAGTAPKNDNWWVEFEIKFVGAGTSDKRVIQEFFATSLDVDGDNRDLQEWVAVEKVKKLILSNASMLASTITNVDNTNGNDYLITGTKVNFAGIDTTAAPVMATYQFQNTDKITIRLGAKTTNYSTSASMRMNAVWFKEFSMAIPAILPVKLVSFSAMLIKDKVDLAWTATNEVNISNYVIEKSTDGLNFSNTGIVFAENNTTEKTNYNFTDHLGGAAAAILYYRLRAADNYGNSKYSDTRIIRLNTEQNQMIKIETYPNPVVNEIRVTVPDAWQNKRAVYEIYSVNGNLVKRTEISNSSQTETLAVNNLLPATYVVLVKCKGEVARKIIIKQ